MIPYVIYFGGFLGCWLTERVLTFSHFSSSCKTDQSFRPLLPSISSPSEGSFHPCPASFLAQNLANEIREALSIQVFYPKFEFQEFSIQVFYPSFRPKSNPFRVFEVSGLTPCTSPREELATPNSKRRRYSSEKKKKKKKRFSWRGWEKTKKQWFWPKG